MGVRGVCVKVHGVCEGQLDLAGALGVGGSGCPRQREPASTTGTPLVVMLWLRNHAILMGGAAAARSTALSPSRLALDTILGPPASGMPAGPQ